MASAIVGGIVQAFPPLRPTLREQQEARFEHGLRRGGWAR